MTTAIIEAKKSNESILFSVTEETVKPLAEKFMSLRINGVDDRQGISAVREARQEIRKARTTVDKERESAKRYYLEEGRRIDGAAKKLCALIEPVESYLVSELDRIDAEVQRIADEKLDRRLGERNDRLQEVGGVPASSAGVYSQQVIRSMADDKFELFVVEMKDLNDRLIAEAKERAEAAERLRIENERIAAERAELERLRAAEIERHRAENARLAEERRIENERLSAEREEQRRVAAEEQRKLDAQRAEQKREQDRIDAERKKLADELAAKQEAERQAELKRLADEAEEKKRIEDEKRRELARPHREKIIAYRDALLAVEVPELPKKLASVASLIGDLRATIADRLDSISSQVEKVK